MPLLAHSARPKQGIAAQPYTRHIQEVRRRASECAYDIARFAKPAAWEATWPDVIRLAAEWHDLGKVDVENQHVLGGSGGGGLPIEHEYAGVQRLLRCKQGSAAALVYAHHRGLPHLRSEVAHCSPFRAFRDETVEKVEELWRQYVALHQNELSELTEPPMHSGNWKMAVENSGGLEWRFALSCLVEGDHSDTARHYQNEQVLELVARRWQERRKALGAYVGRLAAESTATCDRKALRQAVFEACRDQRPSESMYACDSGVGTGKTTAVMAHLLRVAEERGLRHIFVVLPYTNIIDQSVEVYREALVLQGEDPEQVVAAHHHQVDFGTAGLRQLATLWNAPIVVTTAVQFFQTLAACSPAVLRKLHELPGSAVFLDEAHGAIPLTLWPTTWPWLCELSERWGCHFVFASGSLVRFWTAKEIVDPAASMPDLLPAALRLKLHEQERYRIQYRLEKENLRLEQLAARISSEPAQGSVLVVVNTVRTAAVLARFLRRRDEHEVLHLSTALAPTHRRRILESIKGRLAKSTDARWVLVATSCIEAGMDFSFATAFRELSSITSMIQVGGRVNRHSVSASGSVTVFRFDDPQVTGDPSLKSSQQIQGLLFEAGEVERMDAASLATFALNKEMKKTDLLKDQSWELQDAERTLNFPGLAQRYRVIEDASVLVLVPPLREQYEEHERVSGKDVANGSVRIRRSAIEKYGLKVLNGKSEIYGWTLEYDPDFLGYMQGALTVEDALAGDLLEA